MRDVLSRDINGCADPQLLRRLSYGWGNFYYRAGMHLLSLAAVQACHHDALAEEFCDGLPR